jgi:hypothetical protein
MATLPSIDDRSDYYGLLAEFSQPEELMAAAKAAYAAGYRRMDAYTPIPMPGLAESLGKLPTRLPWLTLVGGLLGAASAYAMQYYICVISYPLNVGSRPLHSWPAFIPIVFELTVLGASLFSVLGMLALNGLPMPYHPLFNVPEFRLATRNRFFLCIETRDVSFDWDQTRRFLESLSTRGVTEVPR